MDVNLLNNNEECVSRSTSTIRRARSSSLQKRLPNGKMSTHEHGDVFLPKTAPTPDLITYGGIKLGWIQGVLIPCLLNIWGVMLFLRIAWIVAQAGIGFSLLIIFLSGLVCVLTTLSMSAICTNGDLKGGGIYYIVSRSLGAELGASVGIIFAFANAVAASMNTIGFCNSLNQLLKSLGLKIIDNAEFDVRIVGTVALIVMCFICAVGMEWETKTQNFLIVVIVLAIINYIIGALIGPRNSLQKSQGFVGLSVEMIRANWKPDYRYSEGQHHDFFSVFAMYFPAITGVQAGANICGDLKNPAKAIPQGTLLALGISMLTYLSMALLAGGGALRDASGDDAMLKLEELASCKPNCPYGLHNNYEIMQLMAFWGPLIYGGCWAATLSTALTNLLSVPRLVQALGVDRIYPGLIFFSKPYGKHGEPYRGYVLTFFVSLLFLLIADLNRIAPLITNFYLASYALINFCTFHASFIRHHSWRPTFRFYNMWLSLIGSLMCIIIMMIISWLMAIITMLLFFTLYFLVLYRRPDANWGSSTDAQRYRNTVSSIVQMSLQSQHAKCYNPQLLVLADRGKCSALLEVSCAITQLGSFMIVAEIFNTELSNLQRRSCHEHSDQWLKNNCFHVILDGHNFENGVRSLVQSVGLGRLTPNIVLLGYKTKWQDTADDEATSTYFRVIQYVFEYKLAVAVFRVPEDIRYLKTTEKLPEKAMEEQSKDLHAHIQLTSVLNADSEEDLDSVFKNDSKQYISEQTGLPETELRSVRTENRNNNCKSTIFPQGGTLDVWWLLDDGGLTLLLSYIIARRSKKMNLRVFALAKSSYNNREAEKYMKVILDKLRIDYSTLTLVDGVDQPPSELSWTLFNSLNENTKKEVEYSPRLKAKTSRHLRMRELLLEHSANADCIVMVLPQPRKNQMSALLYMSWLEVLSRDLPPMMLVRGTDTSVLTFEA